MWLVNLRRLVAVSFVLAATSARAAVVPGPVPGDHPAAPERQPRRSQPPRLVKCQHVGGGDGFRHHGDGTQIYLFAFSPLSGLADIQAGLPGTQAADVFNAGYHGPNYSTAGIGLCTGGTNPPAPTQASCNTVADCPTPARRRRATPPGRPRAGPRRPTTARSPTRRHHGHGRARRELARAAHRDRRGRRAVPHPQQPRHDHAAGPLRAAHRPLPRLPERLVLLRTACRRVRRHQHRGQLHLLLHGPRRGDVLLALPHHAARAPRDGHGRPALRAAAPGPADRERLAPRRAHRREPAGRPSIRRPPGSPAPTSSARARRPRRRPTRSPARQVRLQRRRRGRPATTSSTRSR